MSKLTREQRINIYKRRKKGESLKTLSIEYSIQSTDIQYLINLIDKHGEDILRNDKNNYYSAILKEEIINKVLLNNQSVRSTAIEYGLSSKGMLFNWIKSYKDNGYVIVEKTRGRKSTMRPKLNKAYEDMAPEEKVKYLENQNQHLEAEVEYLKKLRAVVQARKNQPPKKK